MNEEKRDEIIKAILGLPIGDGYNLLTEINEVVISERTNQIKNIRVDADSQNKLLTEFENNLASLGSVKKAD